MSDVVKAIALAKKIEERAEGIATDALLAAIGATGGNPRFMAIILGAVHHKIGKLLVETEEKARADG